MASSCPLLSVEQASALLSAKKACSSGVVSSSFAGIGPHAHLLTVMKHYKGRIVFLRHGATAFSEDPKPLMAGGVDPVVLGDSALLAAASENIPLSQKGFEATHAFAQSTEGQNLKQFAQTAWILVSPLRRAQQTATILLGAQPFTTCPHLNEQHLGDDFARPVEDSYRIDNPVAYTPPNGEATVDFLHKVVHTFVRTLEMAKREGVGQILIVGHSGGIGITLASVLVLTNGLVENQDWNGKVESYRPVEIASRPDGQKVVRSFFPK